MKYTPALPLLLLLVAGEALAEQACPNAGPSLCTIARNIRNELGEVAALIEVIATTAGFIFGIIAFLKFKSHGENQQQTPLGVPITWLVCGICLVSITTLFGSGLSTLFGDSLTSAGLVRPPPEKAYSPASRL